MDVIYMADKAYEERLRQNLSQILKRIMKIIQKQNKIQLIQLKSGGNDTVSTKLRKLHDCNELMKKMPINELENEFFIDNEIGSYH